MLIKNIIPFLKKKSIVFLSENPEVLINFFSLLCLYLRAIVHIL